MAIENSRFKTRAEREEEEKKKRTAGGVMLPTYEELTAIEEKAKEDAAAAVSSEKGLDFFQKPSNWDDGYQFGDVTKTALGTLGDVGVDVVKGVVRLGEGVGDAAQFGAAAVADLFGADDKAEAIRRNAQRDKVTEAFSDVDEKLNKYSVLGRTSDAAAESLGQIGGILATGGIAGALGAGAVGATAATTGLMGLSSFGSGTSEAYEAGAEEGEAEAYGAIAGAADALSEMIFGGLGKGFKALGLSKGITSADDVLAKAVTSKIRNTLAKNTVQMGIKAGAEGLEEVLAGTMQAAGKKMTYMSERDFADILADENLLEQFVVGSLASGITQVPSFVSANRAGVDLVSDGGAEGAQGKFADLRDKYADFSEIERTGLASGAKDDDIRMAGELSSALGKKIRFFREEAKNGTINNGEYHEDTDEIWINARSKNVKAQIVAHELTHSIEKHDGYRQLVNMAMEKLEAEQKAKGKTIDDLYRQKELLYADGNVRLGSYEEITSELVAEFVEKRLLTDEASIKSLVSENRTLGQRIREWFDSLLAKMGNASAKEREYIRQMRDVYARALGERVSDTKAEHVSRSLQRIDDTYYVKADRVIFTNEDGTPASERDVFNALVGETIETPEGEIEIVKRLPGKSIYDELYKRRPRYDGVQDIKALNSEINYNMEELLENTSVKEPDILDQEGKHSKQGIVSFDTRTVKFYDGDRAYDVEIDIAKLQNGKKIGYAKKYIGYDAELTKKIQEAEAMGEKSQLNQQPVSNNSISQNGGNVNSKFSVSRVTQDSDGRQLSEGQQEYFRDSKVTDANGNLKVMYHGTTGEGFTVFDKRKAKSSGTFGNGFYFSDSKSHAGQYGKTYEVYLNITNPLTGGTKTITRNQMRDFVEAVAENEDYGIENYGYGATVDSVARSLSSKTDFEALMDINLTCIGNMAEALQLFGEVTGRKYDGIITPMETVVFDPEQIKNIDNLNPTSNPDIRYSVSKSDDPDNKRVMPKRSAAGTKARARQEQQARMRFEQKVMNRGFDNLSPAEQEHYRDEIVGQYRRKYDDYKKKRDALIASGYQFAGVDDYVEKVVGSVEDAAIDANTFLIHYQEGVFGDPTRDDVQDFALDYLQMVGMHRPDTGETYVETQDSVSAVDDEAFRKNTPGVKDAEETTQINEEIERVDPVTEAETDQTLQQIRNDIAADEARYRELSDIVMSNERFNAMMLDEQNAILDEMQSLRERIDRANQIMQDMSYEQDMGVDVPMPGDEDAPLQRRSAQAEYGEPETVEVAGEEDPKLTRKVLHKNIMDRIKEKFAERGFDLDKVFAKAKDLSTFATVDNTPPRVMEKTLGYKEGRILSDLTIDQAARNETEGIRWLNRFTDRKDGVLAKLSKKYNIKPGSKESAAAQMYAEGFYVSDKNEIVEYGDRELAADFPDAQVRENIKGLAHDPIIRQIYDETLDAINASRTRNAFPEIQKLDNYYLHFRAMDDTFSRLGIPFNPNDIRAKDLPTDLNGVTADLKPGQPYFASAKHRLGKRTSFDLLGGMEKYLTSAKNQIYHIDDIQTLRALRNYVADMYGQAEGLSNLDDLSDEEVEARIKDVYGSHLSTFAKFLNEEANVLAGKTSLIDRGLEGVIGRRGITFLNDVNRQVGANMVGYNISSSLTNFLAPVQAFAKMNKAAFVKGFAQTVENRMKSITGNGDDFAEKSDVIVRRKGADRFHRTAWQKMSDPGYLLMGMVDDISTEIIARAKYNELTAKGMDAETANRETDKWVSRLMGDRSLGQMPQIFNSKMLGLVTKFQLEVRNQLDSQFYDTIKEAQVQYEEIGDQAKRNAKTAAKVAATFAELALAQHVFGSVFESIAGYNPAFDIIEVIATLLGLDDDEESEDTALDNIEQGVLALIEDLPYSSVIMDGGRIPVSSAMPIGEIIKGQDEYGNDINRLKTVAEAVPYYALPGGYGQIKKTAKGLSMFSGEKAVTGSYTDSGNLRFPVEATPGNIAQAAVFGQWANENARDYFDNERKPANERQTLGYAESGLEWKEFQRYRDQISKLDRDADKLALIKSLDIDQTAKEALYRYLVASTKKDDDGNIIGSSEDERLAALYATGLGFSDYADAKLKQAELNADEGLTANQRATRFYAWAANKGYTDEQTDAITEQFKFSSGFKVEPTQYKKLIGGGVSPDNAVLVTDALSGASRAIDKINAIWSTGLTGKQLDNAVKAVVTEGWYERYRKVIDANVPLDVLTWVLDNADANGNDSIDNEERVLILSQLMLSQKELSALWEATGGSEKSNPYKGTTGVSMPKINLPKIELPKIELPKIGG